MIYKFKSRAAADVIMLKPNARQLLHILDKVNINDPDDSDGIIMVDQISAALTALQFAIDAEEAALKEAQAQAKAQGASPPHTVVSLRQRAYPIIEMLKRSAKEHCDVIWTV
jgi:hypothetical protein